MSVVAWVFFSLCVCVPGVAPIEPLVRHGDAPIETENAPVEPFVRHALGEAATLAHITKDGPVAVEVGAKGMQAHHHAPAAPSAKHAAIPASLGEVETSLANRKVEPARALISSRSGVSGKTQKEKCPGEIPKHAKCKEGKDIEEGKTCTWQCEDDLKAKPATSKCKCDASSCGLEPSAVECSSGCFPASAKVLRPNGVETSVASMHKGDKVLGLSRAWEPEEHTYLADFHTGQPAQLSRHRFLEIRHACQTGNPLLITSTHLLYAVEASPDKSASGKFRLMPAGSLKPGVHAVLAMGCPGEEGLAASNVLNVAVVWAEGLYSPFTNSRTAIVDGVATSNLALNSESIEKAWYAMPYLQGFAEQLGWLHLAPAQLCAMMGWSVDWVSDKHMQDKINRAVDKILHFILRWTA